jgi:hypothetical protein
MVERTHPGLDEMLRHFMLVGFGALMGWTAATVYGVASAHWDIDTNGALRFMLAVLVVTFAHRTYSEIREWRASKEPTDERLGFAAPVWETSRAAEMTITSDETATEAQQPPQ